MTLWNAAQAAEATAGTAIGDWAVNSVSIDTRTLEPGALFVALKDQRDGHDFVEAALAKGAAAALVSRVPEGVASDAPLLIVEDVLKGLEDLGRAARARTKAKVIGITGSVGKTSTKEMLRVMLQGQGRVHAAEKSYNNHWGVPLTLARMPADTNFAVIEIGMNHPGEIAPLAQLADLDAAMITIVAPAHLEAFGAIEGIAHEKASITEGLRAGGIALLNADLDTSPILFAAAEKPFGFGEHGDFAILKDVRLVQDQTIVQAVIDGEEVLFKIASPGQHFAMNALGALGLIKALGLDLGRAVLDLGQWLPVDGRGVRETVNLDIADERMTFALIDDAYNANPASVGAALDMLAASVPEDGIGRVARGRRVAVLGDMLEMGPTELELHAALASHRAMAEVDIVHCAGPRSKALWNALPQEKQGIWAETSSELAAAAGRIADAGDVVLVKGSLGIRLAHVVDALRKLGQSRP